MFNHSKSMILALSITLGLSACGGGGSSPSNSAVDSKKPSYFIDSPVQGLNYECDDTQGITDANGTLLCDSAPITIKLGEMTLGTLESFTVDAKIYPQDLLDLPRNNFSDANLLKLIRLLQSLDDDGDISTRIVIPSDISSYYSANLNFEQSLLEILAAPAYGETVDEANAIAHLQDSMGSDAYINQTSDSDTNASNGDDAENTLNDILDDTLEDNESNATETEIEEEDFELDEEDFSFDEESLSL